MRMGFGGLRVSWRHMVLWGAAVSSCVLGCGGSEPRTATGTERTPAVVPVLTEHRFRSGSARQAVRALGEDCAIGGPAGCASGVCLHVGAQRDSGYVCTQPCGPGQACPEGWRCGRVHPVDPTSSLCIPPDSGR